MPRNRVDMDFEAELSHCARLLGQPPRRLPLWARLGYLRVKRPPWVRTRRDDLQRYFDSLDELLVRGRLTWGTFVQANALLFKSDPRDCPGELLYGTNPSRHTSPPVLRSIAEQVFELKGTSQPDPAFSTISEYLTNELIRVFGLPVPTLISGDTACAISTSLFVRKHLPGGVLAMLWFPVLVLDEPPRTAMIVPSRYWSDRFVAAWLSEMDAAPA